MEQKQSLGAWFAKAIQSFLSIFNRKETIEAQAELRFGNTTGWAKYGSKVLAYKIMTNIGHIASLILSFFFVYSILYVPAKFIGTNVWLYCSTIAVVFLCAYEWLKITMSKDASDGIILSSGQDGDISEFKGIALILAIGLCFGSFIMCKEGAEDLLAEITDKTTEIKDDGSVLKQSIKQKYDTSLKTETDLLTIELKDIKSDKTKYVNSHSWQGHIDTRDKAITNNIALYDKRISDKEAEIKQLKIDNKKDRETELGEIAAETGTKVAENKGITNIYAKYGRYASLVLEILILFGHFAQSKSLAKLRGKQASTPLPDDASQKSDHNIPFQEPEKNQDNDIDSIARIAIFQLQHRLKTATEGNDSSASESAWKGLERYRQMGYNINTGEYTGIQDTANISLTGVNTPVNTVLTPVLTPEKELILIKNSAILSKYPDVLKSLKNGLSLMQVATECGVSRSIVQQVRRDAIFYGILPPSDN